MIKADCGWTVNSDTYDNILLIADYSSGKAYDEFTVDDDWQNKENSVGQQIWVLLHSILNSDDYDGGIILTDSETRTELSESEIVKNQSGAEAIKRIEGARQMSRSFFSVRKDLPL